MKSYHSGRAKDHRGLAELARRLLLRARLGSSGDARVGVDDEASRVSAAARRFINA